jgi:hypothetical protein
VSKAGVGQGGTGKARAGAGSGRGGAWPRPRRAQRRRPQAADGLETAVDGTVVGQDPRALSPDELRALGHRGKPLLQAMRRRCVDCCGGKKDEVRRCTAVACPLWPYRMGTDPWHPQAKPAAEPEPAQPPAPPLGVPAPPPVAPSAPAAESEETPALRRTPVRRRQQRSGAAAPLLPFLDDVPA